MYTNFHENSGEKTLNERRLPPSIVLTEQRSGASDHQKPRKAAGALDPAVVLPPPPGGVKYVTVTQDKSPCLCSERRDEYLFGRAKTGGLGQVTTKKKYPRKKMGITRPRPDGAVKKKRVLLDPVLTAG